MVIFLHLPVRLETSPSPFQLSPDDQHSTHTHTHTSRVQGQTTVSFPWPSSPSAARYLSTSTLSGLTWGESWSSCKSTLFLSLSLSCKMVGLHSSGGGGGGGGHLLLPSSLLCACLGAVGYAIQHLKSFLPKTKGTTLCVCVCVFVRVCDNYDDYIIGKSTSTETVWNSISKLPRVCKDMSVCLCVCTYPFYVLQKSEIVLEDVTLGYHANRANRYSSC